MITAGTDYVLRVWNSFTTQLVHVLRGHTDELYIIEAHPTEPDILLSAGMYIVRIPNPYLIKLIYVFIYVRIFMHKLLNCLILRVR